MPAARAAGRGEYNTRQKALGGNGNEGDVLRKRAATSNVARQLVRTGRLLAVSRNGRRVAVAIALGLGLTGVWLLGDGPTTRASAAASKIPPTITLMEMLRPKDPTASRAPRPHIEAPGPDEPLRLVADTMHYDRTTGTAAARGQVQINYGPYVVTADEVTYNARADTLTATGNVRLVEPNGNVVESEHITLSNHFREGFVRALTVYLTNEAQILAESGERHEGNVNIFHDVIYTRCRRCVDENGVPLWQIRSRKVTHVEDEATIYHEDATFEIFGRPIVRLPRFSHPDPSVRRKSGFLIPRFVASDEFGFGVEVPYYWNIAPNKDFTFSPVITSEQGPLLKGEWRHRVENGEYSISGAGIYQLDRQAPPGDRRFRGGVRSIGEFDITDNWVWGWDGTLTTDDTFLRRYKVDDRTDIVSQLYLTGLEGRNYFTARAYHFKGLLKDDDNDLMPQALPYAFHSYTFTDPVLGGQLGIDTKHFNIVRVDGTDSTRVVSDLHWKNRMVNGYGQVITPFAHLRGDLYTADNLPGVADDSDTVARLLPKAGLDVRWPFVSYGQSVQHIIEPVAQVIAATNETDLSRIANEDSIVLEFDPTNLFLDDKFTGIDRYEGGTRANVGVNYTMLFDGGRFARFSAGESFHLAGKNSFEPGSGLDTDRSDFVTSVAVQLHEDLLLSSTMRFDEDTLDLERHDLGAVGRFHRLSAAVNYTDVEAAPRYGRLTAEEQIDALVSVDLGRGWRIFGGTRYDIEEDRQLRNLVGIGFDCDCFAMEITYREDFTNDRDIDTDRSVFVMFHLKTLADTGVGTPLD